MTPVDVVNGFTYGIIGVSGDNSHAHKLMLKCWTYEKSCTS